jgi:hypothetical protein
MVVKSSMLALLALAAVSASALTVSVAPTEGPAYAPPPDGRGSSLAVLVSGCMGILFDAGYIVTDASAMRTEPNSWGTAQYGLTDAKEGLVDYVIAIYVTWVTSTFDKKVLLPASVEYRLVRVKDAELISEGSVDGLPDSLDAAAHEWRTASLVGAKVAEPCLKALSAIGKGGE